jgi:hypothetical protein
MGEIFRFLDVLTDPLCFDFISDTAQIPFPWENEKAEGSSESLPYLTLQVFCINQVVPVLRKKWKQKSAFQSPEKMDSGKVTSISAIRIMVSNCFLS